MKPLVSTEWLADYLGEVVVFDTTKYLPNEPKDAMAEFRAAHIPGARFFDIDEAADPDTTLPHMVPTPGRFAKIMAKYGVSNTSMIVFYDQKGLASAARGWWLMGLFGHDKAAVLDGGLPKWIKEGRITESGDAPAPAAGHFLPAYRAHRLRGIGDMIANIATPGELVLDARASNRFRAAVPEIRPGIRAGHMPGSINLPYTELLAPDQTLLPVPDLRARLAAAGVDGSRPVITSCGTGVTACIITLAMTRAGLPAGAVYDGSWTEWGGRTDTQVEIGA